MSTSMRNYIKGIGFILVALGTLGLILNEFVFESSSTRTIIIAAVDVIGLVCLVYGRFWVSGKTAS
jgi:hypothetical protein